MEAGKSTLMIVLQSGISVAFSRRGSRQRTPYLPMLLLVGPPEITRAIITGGTARLRSVGTFARITAMTTTYTLLSALTTPEYRSRRPRSRREHRHLHLNPTLDYQPTVLSRPLTMLDGDKIASQVYEWADGDEPISPLIKEALTVIEEALDDYG